MRRYLPFIIVAGVALLTLATGTMFYRAKRLPVLTIQKDQREKEGAQSLHIRGQPNAPVTLEEFGDFQCPPCGTISGPIKQLEKDYHSDLRIIFHNFPLANHAHAR